MYDVYVFDLDGTLLDTLPSITAGVNRALASYHLPPVSLERARQLVGNASQYLTDHALEDAGVDWDEDQRRAFVDVYHQAYWSDPIEATHPYDGVARLLEALKDGGKRLMVFSNKPDALVVRLVHHFFGTELFEQVRGLREGVPRKPDPAGLFDMMRDAGVESDRVLYIGDSEVDAALGKAAGVDTVLLTSGYRSAQELEPLKVSAKYASVEALYEGLMRAIQAEKRDDGEKSGGGYEARYSGRTCSGEGEEKR